MSLQFFLTYLFNNDKDELLDICNDLNASFPDVDSKPLLSVVPSDVLCTIRRLKSGKFDGDFGLSTDHFVNACNELAVHLSMLYSAMLIHGYFPQVTARCTIMPIPKGKNVNVTTSQKYRGISL